MLVDGAQSVPHMPVDVQKVGMDFLAFSGHKMLGPTDIGVLYGKQEILEKMPPFQGGGEMINKVTYNQKRCNISWNELLGKFEAGTPNICGAIGLGVAVKYLQGLGTVNVFSHEKELTKYAVGRMRECSKVTVYGPADLSMKCGIIPFSVEGLSSHEAATFFDEYGIATRSGYHCAHPLHQIFKLQSSARASFYIYNTKGEVDRFVEVLGNLER